MDQLSSDLASLRIQRDAPPSNKGTVFRVVLGAVVVVILLGAAYVFAGPYIEARVFRPTVDATEIMLVSPAQSQIDLTSTGYVVALKKSKVGAKVNGRMARLLVKEGDSVKAGQLIAELEDSEQLSLIRSAKSKVLAAKARAELARANLAETKVQAERQKTLAEKNAAPKATADDLFMHARSLEESLKAAEAESVSSEAEVESLNVTLQQMRVSSPMAGTVIEKISDAGELVGPGQNPIVEMADFDSLVVETDVPESRLHHVKVGGPCEIVLDAYPGRRYRCEAKEIVPRVNRSKATVPVRVTFVDARDGVFPDMAARVSFLQQALDADAMKEPPHLVVPDNAVAERAGGKVVFVLDGDQVRMTSIAIGAPFGGGFELTRGPPQGTKVVRNPPPTLEDGSMVKERNK
jgi:RND family efflux transporter MFP subunit